MASVVGISLMLACATGEVTPGILNMGGDMMRAPRRTMHKHNRTVASLSSSSSSNEVDMSVAETQVAIGGSASLSWAESNGASYVPCVGGDDWIGIYCGDEPSSIADASWETWQCVGVAIAPRDGYDTPRSGANRTDALRESGAEPHLCVSLSLDPIERYVDTIASGACDSGNGAGPWAIGAADDDAGSYTVGDVCEFRLFDHEDGSSYCKIGASPGCG